MQRSASAEIREKIEREFNERVAGVVARRKKGRKHVRLNVMMPLDLHKWNVQSIERRLRRLKEMGVHGVMADMWWGLIEGEPGKYDWSFYRQVVEAAERVGIDVEFVMCADPAAPWPLPPPAARAGGEAGGVGQVLPHVWRQRGRQRLHSAAPVGHERGPRPRHGQGPRPRPRPRPRRGRRAAEAGRAGGGSASTRIGAGRRTRSTSPWARSRRSGSRGARR